MASEGQLESLRGLVGRLDALNVKVNEHDQGRAWKNRKKCHKRNGFGRCGETHVVVNESLFVALAAMKDNVASGVMNFVAERE